MKEKLLHIYPILKLYFLQNRSHKQTIFKNTFWLMMGEGVSKLVLFIITIVITRYLGVENYGKYSFAFAFTALFSVFTDLGFNTLIAKEIATDLSVAKKHIDNIIVIKLLAGIVTFGIIFLVIHVLGKSSDVRLLVYLAAIYTVIQSYILFFQAVYQGYEKMQYSFISKSIFVFILFFTIIPIVVVHLTTPYLIVGYNFAGVITLAILLILTRRFLRTYYIGFDFHFWKRIFSLSWPLLAGAICITIYVNSDSVLLSIFRNYKEVGLYQSAYKIFFAFQSINLIHQVIYPKLANLYSKKLHKEYNKLLKVFFTYSLAVLIPVGVIITLFSKQILFLIYGKEFIGASFALTCLIWTGILIHFSTMWSNNLLIYNMQKKWFYSAFMGALVNLVFNLIFIPLYGITAAAITTLLSEIIVFIFIYSQNSKETRNFIFQV